MHAAAGLAAAAAASAAPASGTMAVRGLVKRFGNRAVLDGVDLTVRRGEALALIGANGAGKSTLLRCALRLVEPDEGRLVLLDTDVRALRRAALRRLRARVGFVFQRHNLVPRLSVLTNVLHGAQARRTWPDVWFQSLAPRALREEALDCLNQVGLADLAGRRADRLSAGQSQRVAIARALMQRPDMMFADEPMASLDPAAGEEVMRLFVELVRRRGLTLVFTTHALDHALAYGERVVGLRAGGIALDRPAAGLSGVELRGFYE
jgi:phosphonate transport system ATP-binding protein